MAHFKLSYFVAILAGLSVALGVEGIMVPSIAFGLGVFFGLLSIITALYFHP